MSIAQAVVGVACLLVGGHNVIRREAIVARHRQRNPGKVSIQPPMAYAVSGGIVALAGIVFILAALAALL
jgi:hypothetical protein